ncbi:MAG: presenilin family intramembrane aspartyl protease [Candidatus Marsarchaeota archaeon]|jgi:presenilin-like A22 family membrane protease|nr:presenilin family intramembrane aspartyl protease [Candidatus Marsarchaeota archaeon]MCL5115137.1 presenilin family intramembrane aspartyl protease [Candidatus Marsarchaeota archaeon]
MFIIVQFFGLLLASLVFSGATYQQVRSTEVISSALNVLFYIGYIIIFAAVLLLILKIYKGSKVLIILEGVVIFISSFFVFLIISGEVTSLLLFSIAGLQITANFVLAIAGAAILILAKNRWKYLRNTAAIIASAGVGVILGISFGFIASLLFMAIVALYDFIAVFITKHMITLAEAAVSNNLALLVGVDEYEALPKSNFSAAELNEYDKETKGIRKGIIAKLYNRGMVTVSARSMLGTGDLAIPLMVAVSAYGAHLNFVLSFFIIGGAVLGLYATTLILKKYKRALPAIPPLLAGVLVGIGAYIAVFGISAL